jgi:heme/copper-type cytochrome/quinol oxidase subunit 1
MEKVALRFIRWGAGLLVLGLLTGYGPLGHYLMGGVQHACPWAPIHGHVALLGWIGMTLFGLVYDALPRWANGKLPSMRLAKAHFYFCVAAVLGVFTNGIVGYRLLDIISPEFYYLPDKQILNTWLAIDGIFLSLYGVGCALFLLTVLSSTKYAPQSGTLHSNLYT